MTLVDQPVVVARTGTDGLGVETIDYDNLDQPAVIRRRERAPAMAPAYDAADIPAFLRKQAD
jgi:hypothetical protein